MGVWIETFYVISTAAISMSHPVWVCGLKLGVVFVVLREIEVTPCMGVWIETDIGRI